jgi:Na+-translocating ferredoxin:NAD+ oxidoreductase subunit D
MTEEQPSIAEPRLHLSTSPHILHKGGVPSIMLSVVIALSPAMIGSVVFFYGIRALVLTCVCCAAAVGAEWAITSFAKKESTIGDYSSLVTGILLAFSLPPDLPLWMAALGGIFAIVVAKMAFGGLGANFINPALAGRSFLMLSFPAAMTHWIAPLHGTMNGLSKELDGISAATPLVYFKNALASGNFHPLDFQEALPRLFWGNVGGCLGETSAALLFTGALFLLYKRIIGFRIPTAFLGTTFILFWIFNGTGEFLTSEAVIVPFYQLLSGGLILGALFMAADPVSTPITPSGRFIFGVGCGVLTFFIRKFGGYTEGVCFAILIMNCCTPLIERYTQPQRFSETTKNE